MVGYCPLIDGVEYNNYTLFSNSRSSHQYYHGSGRYHNNIWSCYLCEGQTNTVEICKQIFRCCELTGNVSYCTELLDSYRQKVLKLGTWRSANSVRGVRDAPGMTSILVKGKSYNRGMQTHKLCLEAFFRLVRPEFVKWYTISSSCEQSRPISQEQLRG